MFHKQKDGCGSTMLYPVWEKKHGLLGEISENSYERKDAKIKAVSHQNVIHLLYFSSAVEIVK
jgi:hypothetical protein